MSSPIARQGHAGASAGLIELHQKLTHSRRVALLGELLAQRIAKLNTQPSCLDIGCGDMAISETINRALPASSWQCLDLYALPDKFRSDARWSKYHQFDGRKLPMGDCSSDIAVFCDVLHHMPAGVPQIMLAEAGRVARHVVVKDHFEYGWWSRSCLRSMDFIGNWAYGVSVPRRYFTCDSFAAHVDRAGLRIDSLEIGFNLYSHLPIVQNFLAKKWQFVAVLSRKP
jgi:SAM-dependent methyltransferase